MTEKKLGIVGGMGTAAGLHFARRLVELNQCATQDSAHVSFILHSEPAIPDRSTAFIHDGVNPATAIVHSFNNLARSGANFGVMICNTAHIYFEQIVKGSNLPIINMIENVARSVEGKGILQAGLLATTATVRAGLYSKAFEKLGIRVIAPDADAQERLHNAIYDREYGLKATGTRISEEALATVASTANELEKKYGLTHFILGCTELSMLSRCNEMQRWTLIDPVDALAQQCLAVARTFN